jgi:hypothetical protein
MAEKLSSSDHGLLDKFLGVILDRYREGGQTRVQAISMIAHLVAAIDLEGGDDPRAYMKAIIADEGA